MPIPTDSAPFLSDQSAKIPLGRILLVDDEVKLLTILSELLTAQGYEVVAVTSGQDALANLQKTEFDLLLTDLMMPEMDGISLLRQALTIDPHLMSIIMTGQGTVPTAVEAMKGGAFDYVLKPFKMNMIMPILARAMEVHRISAENIQLRGTVAIYELSQTVALTLDSKMIVEKVADSALQQFAADEASVMLFLGKKSELYIAAVRGVQREHLLGQRVPLDQGIAGWVARHQQPVVLYGEVQDQRFVPLRPRPDICSAISLPMLVGNKLVGVLNINVTQHHRRFMSGQIKALSVLTSTAAAALESAQLYEESERLLKELRHANRLKDEFLATMSHELRTPLHVIIGYTDLLLEGTFGELSTEQQDGLQRAQRAAYDEFKLISQLLDVSALESGTIAMSVQEVQIPELLAETMTEIHGLLLGNPHIQLQWQAPAHLPPLQTDRTKLKLVLKNLLGNAVKFTETGTVTVSACARDGGMEITVTDTGIGIAPEVQPFLFDKFRQGDGSNTRRYGGVGLGLYIVKQTLELLSGTVTVASAVGKGSTFSVWLPQGGEHTFLRDRRA
jgi:signal transduction histidine kinase/FixJ family two-component response regulator